MDQEKKYKYLENNFLNTKEITELSWWRVVENLNKIVIINQKPLV